MVKIIFKTDYRSVPIWIAPDMIYQWASICSACGISANTVSGFLSQVSMGRCIAPRTITSRKVGDFFRVTDFNLDEDVLV